MDAAQALAELTELSSQVQRAVVVRGTAPCSLATRGRRGALATAALELLAAAFDLRSSPQEVTRVEVELADGALRPPRGWADDRRDDGPDPTSGLVATTCRTCLQRISEPEKPRRRRAAKAAEEAGSETAVPARSRGRARGLGVADVLRRSRLQERAVAAYADGSSVVLEPGSDGFERLAAIARSALR